MSAVLATLRRRGVARARRLAGDRRVRRLRARAFRTVQRARGLPLIRPNLFLVLPDGGCLLTGAMVDPGRRVVGIELLREGRPVEDITSLVHRFDDGRPSLFRTMVAPGEPIRFAAHLGAPPAADDVPPHAVAFVLEDGRRERRRLPAPERTGDPLASIRRVLAGVPASHPDKRHLFDRVYGPAVRAIWAGRRRDACRVDVVEHNEHLSPEAPTVSLVVPIYGRYDFIEHQLAQFANDPDMARHEILYVIDDPRLDAEVRQSCATLARTHSIAFRVLHLSSNLGYAGANNVGVEHARGRRVLLLNSDVMPREPGWLARLLDEAGERLDTSVVGARLLYEDDSVQHDGMRFFDSPFVNGLWTNVHPGKGLPLGVFPSRAGLVPRQSVTGACLLMDRGAYARIGGFDEGYVLGDYEDSDLCLAARRAGLDVALAERVVLYHLERQSQSLVSSDRWKEELTYYNCWYHSAKWDADIRDLVRNLPA